MKDPLTILTWPDYINPATLEQFGREFDVEVQLDVVPSAVELVEKMRAPVPQADLLVPPDYAVRELTAQGKLATLNRDSLPGLRHLSPRFLHGRAHDPDTRVSVIKDWGSTGFMYRTDHITEKLQSWADFWRLAGRYSGRVTLLDSPGEVIGAALKMRGHSYNAGSEGALADARRDLLALKPHVLAFVTDYKPKLASGEAVLALGWNGDAAALKANGVPIRYVIPAEGSQIWEDDWAISASSPRRDLAHAFLDFVLRPGIAAQEAHYTRYATGNRTALALLDSAERADPSIYPPDDLLLMLEPALPLGPEVQSMRLAIWEQLRR